MYPKDQQDGRTLVTLEATSSPSADGSNSRKPASADENSIESSRTLVLVSIAYPRCCEKKKTVDGNGKEKTELKSMELKSVPYDLELLMAQHTRDNNGTRRVFICADHPHRYKDSKNISVRGASKSEILGCFEEAVSIGGPLVIYYSGHCGCTGGKWMATFNNGTWEYEEYEATESKAKEGKAKEGGTKDPEPPYLISSDCQQIYGKEVGAALSKGLDLNDGRKMTILLIFDTCHVATFFDHVIKFPYIYRAKALRGLETNPLGKQSFGQNQIIFLPATQFNQQAGVFCQEPDRTKSNGAVTTLIDEFLRDPKVPKTAEELVERLYTKCLDEGYSRQTPEIRALFPIEGDLELLLG